MSLIAHPTDARLRCLTEAQVEALATLHTRPLVRTPLTPLFVLPESSVSSQPVPDHPEADSLPVPPTDPQPLKSEETRLLLQKLAALEMQVSALQEQLTHLTQELREARQLRSEQRLGTLEALVLQMKGTVPTPQALPQHPETKPRPTSEPPEAPKSRSSQLPPLVEYTAEGTYMILSPSDGELTFSPDSPQWFAWLETISSFHFRGKLGSFSLHRRAGRQNWQARRERNGRRYYQSFSHTRLLTIATLEQTAATIQSSGPSH